MRAFLGLCAVFLVSGCLDQLEQSIGGVRPATVFAAQSTDEVIALGGVRLLEEDLIDAFAGQTLEEPNEDWVWDIGEDGQQSARANDGSWADAPGGQWQVVNNQFCRENEDLALKCSDVYQIGPFYRFTELDGSLSVWTVTKS